MNRIGKFFRIRLEKIAGSIAFYPALIAVAFLLLSFAMIEFDFSETGKQFKAQLKWVSLKDASTARSIISTIAGAIISLTVFSFSMVMIVLNQAASQMSNRVLSSMIENRFQQIVLGFYIGTVVYALSLLSTIRDINSGIYVPAMSIYLLILLTIVDIFLFIYFLDYVTRTVKYETVIFRVHQTALKSMQKDYTSQQDSYRKNVDGDVFRSRESGYFQGFNKKKLVKLLTEQDLVLAFLHPRGSYVVRDTPFLRISCKNQISPDCLSEVFSSIDFYQGQPIEKNPDYGFRQLAEIGIKALSPGINDPATAVLTIQALTDLFAFRLHHAAASEIPDSSGTIRLYIPEHSFESSFHFCMGPIRQYGKEDRYVQHALHVMCQTLTELDVAGVHRTLFSGFAEKSEATGTD